MPNTSYDALCGAVAGLFWGISYRDIPGSLIASECFSDSGSYSGIRTVCESISKNHEIDSDDIANRLSNFHMEFDEDSGEMLCWIFPLGFFTAYENDGTLSENVAKICGATHNYESSKLVAIEYVRLIHDIFWHYISDPSKIIDVLPELDILASEVVVSNNAKDIFFASLWAFAHSKDFLSAMSNVEELSSSNEFIFCVTGTLAGLYYGSDPVLIDFINDNKLESSIQTLKF